MRRTSPVPLLALPLTALPTPKKSKPDTQGGTLSRKCGWQVLSTSLLLALAPAFPGAGQALAGGGVPAGGPSATRSAQAAAIVGLAREAMVRNHLKAVILRVTVDGRELVTAALGESMTGVPATTDMHFRNGAVAIAYMSTLLLQLVDQGRVSLDNPLSNWLPDLPDASRVTLRMLANMTAGYPDYVRTERLSAFQYANPFRQFTPQDLISIGLSNPRVFAPGTNWDYSHTNYVILGQALEKITGKPMATLMRENIFVPLGLKNTDSVSTAAIREPVLHAYTSERKEALGIAPTVPFYEDSTYWSPSWTLARGAIQTTNIYDMTRSAEAIGKGTLLSPASHKAQIATSLLGFGTSLPGCAPVCHTLNRNYNYGLGVVRSGSWILQNPLFAGTGSIMAYLPSKRIAVAVVTTFGEKAFDEQGNNGSERASTALYTAIGTLLAPGDPPPPPVTR